MVKCQGIIKINDGECTKDAIFDLIGLSAQYGAPNIAHVCNDCLELAKKSFPNGFPMIQSYNEFPLVWRKINTNDSFENIDGKKFDLDTSMWVG